MADKKPVRLTQNEITLILSRLTGDTPLTRKLKQASKTKPKKLKGGAIKGNLLRPISEY